MNQSLSMSLQQVVAHTQTKRERHLDRERADREESAEDNRRKDEFLAMLGHELRNPLSCIVGAVQILEELSCQDSVAMEMHGVIKRQSLHVTKLVDDLLTSLELPAVRFYCR